MEEKDNGIAIPDELLITKIYMIRGKKVMLDRDLAELYGVETKRLKEAVRRNLDRFPDDFMIELTQKELSLWRTQFATSNADRKGLRIPPFAFTEHGVLMLASVLNSKRAIQVNIQIVRVFNKMRGLLSSQQELLQKLKQLEKKDLEQDEKIMMIFEYLKQLEQIKQKETDFKNRTKERSVIDLHPF